MANNRSDHIQQENDIFLYCTIDSQAWGRTVLHNSNNSNPISVWVFVFFIQVVTDVRFSVSVVEVPESIDKFIFLFDYALCNILELQLKLFYILCLHDIQADIIFYDLF